MDYDLLRLAIYYKWDTIKHIDRLVLVAEIMANCPVSLNIKMSTITEWQPHQYHYIEPLLKLVKDGEELECVFKYVLGTNEKVRLAALLEAFKPQLKYIPLVKYQPHS